MKIRLNKSMMAVVFAAVAGSSVTEAAAYFDSIDEIVNVEGGQSLIQGPKVWDEVPTSSYSIAKDGAGKLIYTGSATEYCTVYVREGELQIGDGSTATNLKFSPRSYGAEGRYTGFGVAGKDAVLRINNASVSTVETAHFVGGADGNGSMIIENGSDVNLQGGNVFVIGDLSLESLGVANGVAPDGYNNSTTAEVGGSTESADTRYVGNYTKAANGSGYTFGRGEVKVTGGSVFKATYGNFWMAEGSFTAEGEGTKVEVGLNGYGYRTWLGLGENATSEITVKDGASMEVCATEFYSNNSQDSSSVISVDGKDSVFTIKDQTAANGEEKDNVAYFGANGSKTSATIKVTNGAEARLESDKTYLGSTGSDAVNRTCNVEIGVDSKLYAYDVTVNEGADVTNDGTIEISDDGFLSVIGEGEVINNGIIDGDAWIYDGGTLTATDGSTLSRVYLGSGITDVNDGTLIIDGDVSMLGSLTEFYGDGAEIVFTEGSSLDMNGNAITLGNISLVYSVDYTVTDVTLFDDVPSLFSNYAAESDIDSGTYVVVRGLDGSTSTRYLSNINQVAVPEPATVTLSLLALVGLTMRRRRR